MREGLSYSGQSLLWWSEFNKSDLAWLKFLSQPHWEGDSILRRNLRFVFYLYHSDINSTLRRLWVRRPHSKLVTKLDYNAKGDFHLTQDGAPYMMPNVMFGAAERVEI